MTSKRMSVRLQHNYTSKHVIAECLNVRLIIVKARQVLVGFWSEVVLVCMSVRNGFTIKIYGFMRSLRTSLACVAYVKPSNGSQTI